MKQTYETPTIVDLGSVSEMTRAMTGPYADNALGGMAMPMMAMP